MITVEEALSQCLDLVAILKTEQVPLTAAAGRYLTEPLTAFRPQPPFSASAMDGYAVAVDPSAGDSFTVVGEAGAGHQWSGLLEPHQAIRIFTGAPVPQGAKRVIIQEDLDRFGDRITVKPGADAATHIRPEGQDFASGFALSPRRLGPFDLALAAAMNHPTVTVARKPIIALIATGDELVMPGEVPRDDQIITSNTFALKAMIEAEGAEVRMLPIARDNEPALREVFELAEGADLIVTTGGASVGDHDLVGKVAIDLGMERKFWKLAMRPGKPLMAGRMGRAAMLGLPGNPVSSVVCAILFLLPMIRKMLGAPAHLIAPRSRQAVLVTDVDANGARVHYMRARLGTTDSHPTITPFDRQDSSLLTVLAEADALLIRPIGDGPRRAGEVVDYLPL